MMLNSSSQSLDRRRRPPGWKMTEGTNPQAKLEVGQMGRVNVREGGLTASQVFSTVSPAEVLAWHHQVDNRVLLSWLR
jgi:hypothetical protein